MALAKQFLNMGKLHRSALWKHLCLETSLSVFGVYLIGRETITTSVTFKVTLIITVTATSDGSVTEIQKANSSQRAMDYIQTQLSCIFLVKKMLKKKKCQPRYLFTWSKRHSHPPVPDKYNGNKQEGRQNCQNWQDVQAQMLVLKAVHFC